MKFLSTSIIFIIFIATVANAQTQRVYLCPIVLDAVGARVPKYIWELDYSRMDAGGANICICRVMVTDESASIMAKANDVFTFPEKLETKPTRDDLDKLKTLLAGYSIPTDGIIGTMSYHQIIERLCKIFFIAQKYYGDVTSGKDLFKATALDANVRDADAMRKLEIEATLDALKLPFRKEDIDPGMKFRWMIQDAAESVSARIEIVEVLRK